MDDLFWYLYLFFMNVFLPVAGGAATIYLIGKFINFHYRKKRAYSRVAFEKSQEIENYVSMLVNNKILEHARRTHRSYKYFSLFLVGILVYISLILHLITPFVLLFGIVAYILIIVISTKKYEAVYKEQVITSILKNFDDDLQYDPKGRFDEDIYRMGRFELFEIFGSEDLITGNVCDYEFFLADVHTKRAERNREGKLVSSVTMFKGPVAVLNLDKLHLFGLYITDNKSKIFNNNEYIQLDNLRFENKFDVLTDNELMAMRILTPDLTNLIIDLHDNFGFFFEIKLINGYLFFRFHTDTLFNPCPDNVRKEALDIAFYFTMLDGMKKIIAEIVKNLNDFKV